MSGLFSQAVFGSKEIFADAIFDTFEKCESRKEKIQFVDEHLPEIPFISQICQDVIRDTFDNEDNEDVKTSPGSSQDCFLGRIFSSDSNCSVLSRKAKFQFQESRGRFLVAKEEIRMGEIVAVENPIVAFPINHEWKRFCNFCQRNLNISETKVECETCGLVTWCSPQCQSAAMRSHHRFECGLRLPEILENERPGLGKFFLPLRLIAQKSVSFFRSVFSNLQNPDTSFGLKEEHISSDYVTVSHLTRHDAMTGAQELEICLMSVIFMRMMEAVGYFSEASSDDRIFIAVVLSILVRLVNYNTHPLHDSSSESQEVIVAAALYPVVASVCNHSCDPNLIRASYGGKLVLAAGRDIPKGAELSDMYTVHWTEYETEERKSYLQRAFSFTCNCTACDQGWEPQDFEIENPTPDLQKRAFLHNQRTATESRLLKLLFLNK